MAKTSYEFRESLRHLKNDIIRQYFEFRINTPSDPYSILFKPQPYRILLILSHMRSGSSLLSHILSSNPEIIGYGETHLHYASERDFKNLIFKVYANRSDSQNLQMSHKYVLDKVLHNNKFVDIEFMNSEKLYTIFLVREPRRSLPSIIDLKPKWTEEKAVHYYAGRLPVLEDYAKLIHNKERSLFITHDQLLNQTPAVFDALQNLLGTQQAFSEEYNVFKTTGTKGIGDSKGNIKAGRIIRDRRKIDRNVAPDLVAQGMRAFEQCVATLSEYCTTIESDKALVKDPVSPIS
jgi:hypothetical protein